MTYLTREDRRDQVMAAAVDLVISGGLAAATVRRIAQRIGCSPGQIHHHFASADALRAAAVREVWQRIEPVFLAEISKMSPRDRLLALLSDEHPKLPMAVIEYLAVTKRLWNEAWDTRSAPMVREAIVAALREVRACVADALKEGVSSGAFSPQLDPTRLSLILLAASQGFDVLAEVFDENELPGTKPVFVDAILAAHGIPATP
jgi:AcrR family transcriptional regulator